MQPKWKYGFTGYVVTDPRVTQQDSGQAQQLSFTGREILTVFKHLRGQLTTQRTHLNR